MDSYLIRRIFFYLTYDQIKKLHRKHPNNWWLKWRFDQYIHNQSGFEEACRQGNLFGITNLIERNPSWVEWKYGLSEACLTGQREVISLFIQHKKDTDWSSWRYGLSQACFGGHIDIAKLAICKGADDKFHLESWENMFYACKNGHFEMVKYMIRQGSKEWENGLCGACFGGHLNIAKFMIRKGATNWEHGLEYACEGGHLDLVHLMIRQLLKSFKNLHNSPTDKLLLICDELQANPDYQHIKKAVDSIRHHCLELWNRCLYRACENHHQNVVDLMIQYGASGCNCGKSLEKHLSDFSPEDDSSEKSFGDDYSE